MCVHWISDLLTSTFKKSIILKLFRAGHWFFQWCLMILKSNFSKNFSTLGEFSKDLWAKEVTVRFFFAIVSLGRTEQVWEFLLECPNWAHPKCGYTWVTFRVDLMSNLRPCSHFLHSLFPFQQSSHTICSRLYILYFNLFFFQPTTLVFFSFPPPLSVSWSFICLCRFVLLSVNLFQPPFLLLSHLSLVQWGWFSIELVCFQLLLNSCRTIFFEDGKFISSLVEIPARLFLIVLQH